MKRKVEAWLIEEKRVHGGRRQVTDARGVSLRQIRGDLRAIDRVVPLVRRDLKAEAVLRAALKLEKHVADFIEFPEGFHNAALDVANAAAEYRASRKRRAKRC